MTGKIPSVYKVETGTFDNTKLPNGITNQGCSVYKEGKMVQLNLNLKASTQMSPAAIPIEFIPEGFRPYAETQFMFSDGGTTGQTVGKIGNVITVYFGSTKYAQGSITYIQGA